VHILAPCSVSINIPVSAADVSRESFSYAEFREDHAQQIFHINTASDPSERCPGEP
jgi:hypothetical protein